MPINSRLEKLKEGNLQNIPEIKNRRKGNAGVKEFIFQSQPSYSTIETVEKV